MIRRSGYRSHTDKRTLQKFYDTGAWKAAQAFARARANGRCEWCGVAPRPGQRQHDVVHLEGHTLELVRAGDPLDLTQLAVGCRRCHSQFAAGLRARPPGR